MHHHFIRAADVKPTPAFPKHAKGYRRFALSDRSVGAVHTGWGMSDLNAGGLVDLAIQSFEESFYVLAGNPTLILDGRGYRLSPGACGLIGEAALARECAVTAEDLAVTIHAHPPLSETFMEAAETLLR